MNLDLIESESESEMSSDSEVSHSRRHILLSSSREWILQLFAKEAENIKKP
jgi:C4-dicarboxylate-specific signal transduction histidine kinase